MLRALPYLLAMLVVPLLFVLVATGSWRNTWRYSKDWLRSIGILLAIGAVAALVFTAG